MSQTLSPALHKVLNGSLCSGCGACAALAPQAIHMETLPPGYLRPVQTAKLDAATEARFTRICPGLGLTQDAGNRPDHPLWGPFVAMRSGHASDAALRRNASSGGALSALLVHLLQTGIVDFVLQTAASPDLAIGNTTVLSRDAAQVSAAAGSRYAPSAPLEGIGKYLDSHTYAFVGKPCDVAALRSMAKFDPRIDAHFPIMLSFFCAGVPSLTGARQVLAALGAEEPDVSAFRYRGDGWPGFAKATLRDGSSTQMSYAESWGNILSKHVQFRCRICPDGTGGFADIVCADAWEADAAGYPVFSERDGISLIVSRTGKGEDIVAQAMAAGGIVAGRFDPEALAAIQPGQKSRRRDTLARLLALRLLGRPTPVYRGFHLARNAARAGLWRNAKNLLGTIRRALQGRL